MIGTLDTKGEEVGYLQKHIEQRGCQPIVMDVGILGQPTCSAGVTRQEVAQAGGSTLAAVSVADRRMAVQVMAQGATEIARTLYQAGRLNGAIAVGGGTGTFIGSAVLRALPIGVPKVMVSTVASRDLRETIGAKDITIMHSVVDMLGLNAVNRKILANAAGAIVGMVEGGVELKPTKALIGVTVFGFCTEGGLHVKAALEERGYEMVAFHANGTGGMAMEDLVEQGLLVGVIDFATHEFADQLHGGYCGRIGPGRLESAGRRGIPQVVVPGGLDCIVLEFDRPETIPPQFRDRQIFWYDFRSGVRTSLAEVETLAETIAAKLNQAIGPTRVLVPTKGWSEADIEGGPLYAPHINRAWVEFLKRQLKPSIPVVEVEAHINDPAFAQAAVAALDDMRKY